VSLIEMVLLTAAIAATVILAIIAGYWALAKVILSQMNASLDVRFDALENARREGRKVSEERFKRLEDKQAALEADLRKVLIELPREYMRREDHIRFETLITAKLDAINSEMRLLAERLPKREG